MYLPPQSHHKVTLWIKPSFGYFFKWHFDNCIPLGPSILVDSGDEVFEGVVHTLSGRFKAHFDLGLWGGVWAEF